MKKSLLIKPPIRITVHPDLVHVQFERRRARQFTKLIDRNAVKMAVTVSQRAQSWNGLILTGSHG